MQEVIDEFYVKYDNFIKKISTGNKTKFKSLETINTINDVLKALIIIVELNELDKIENWEIYNLLLISKIYIKKVPEPTMYTPRKWALINLKDNLKKLENLNIKQDYYKSRH